MTFGPAIPLPAGGFYMGVGDLNFDGKPDMVQTHFDSTASVYTGDGDGTFTTRTPLTVGTTADDAVIADFTTDNSKQDIAVINFGSRNVTMFVNTTATAGAAPTFDASTTHSIGAAGNGRNTTAAADFDGGGGLDLAVPTFMDNQVSVLLGNGEGLLGAPFQFATTAAGGGELAAAGDLDGDFKPDLVVANFFTDNVSALLNTTAATGTATFAPKQDAPAGDGARAVAIGDLNADLDADVAVANENAQSLTVLIGNGDGTFDSAVPYAIGTGTAGVAIGDLDADGKNDIVVSKGNGAGFFKADGDGTFQPILSLTGAASSDIDIADLNNDSKPDIVTDTQVFLNTTAPPVPPGGGGGGGGGGVLGVSAQSGLPAPQARKTVNVAVVKGTVKIKQPGQRSFRTLSDPAQIRMGSIIDATKGRVRADHRRGRRQDPDRRVLRRDLQGHPDQGQEADHRPDAGRQARRLQEARQGERRGQEAQGPAAVGHRQGPLPHPRQALLRTCARHDLAGGGPLQRHHLHPCPQGSRAGARLRTQAQHHRPRRTHLHRPRAQTLMRRASGVLPAAVLVLLVLAAPAQAQPSFITKWGSPGSGNGQFDIPNGVATDAAGNVYVADSNNHRIQKFTSGGAFIRKWGSRGTGAGQFDYPVGVATDAAGNVYVTENSFDSQRVQKFTSNGAFITTWGSKGSGNGQFSYPNGIATDTAGNVYVADPGSPVPGFPGNNRIQKFTSNGAFITKWGGFGSGNGQLNVPTGVATDAVGNVYVVDNRNHRIQKFTSNGAFITAWGGQGSGNARFEYPFLIATDASSNVYVGDSDNQRIQMFTSNGAFVAKWGNRGTGDGQFRYPSGIATDDGGNVYVADGASNRIQKFGRPPVAGRCFNAELVSGRVYFKCRGDKRRRRLRATTQLPVGCLIDARMGRVRITAAANADASKTKSAVFYSGQFRVLERRSGRPVTELRLAGKLSALPGQGLGGREEAQGPSAVGQRQGPLPHPRQALLRTCARHDLAGRGPLRRHHPHSGRAGDGSRSATSCASGRRSCAPAAPTSPGPADPRARRRYALITRLGALIRQASSINSASSCGSTFSRRIST